MSEAWTWNANLTLASHTDGNGNETTFGSYDQNGNPTSIVEAAGTSEQRTTNVTYHPVLSRPISLSIASANGNGQHVISWDYTCHYFVQPGNVYTPKLTNHINSITDSGYTASSLPGTLDASETHTVQIQYVRDPCGGHTLVSGVNRVSSISGPTVPPGQSTAYVYASYVVPQTTFDYSATTGYRAHETNLVGNGTLLTTTFNSYDADGRLLERTDPNGTNTTTAYDGAGAIASVTTTSQDGSQTSVKQYVRDLAGDLTQEITPEGTLVQTEYDSALRPWRTSGWTKARATVWSQVRDYDAFDRPVTNRNFGGMGLDEGVGCFPLAQSKCLTALRMIPTKDLLASKHSTQIQMGLVTQTARKKTVQPITPMTATATY